MSKNCQTVEMNCYERFSRVVHLWGRSLLKLVGHDILADEFKKSALFYAAYSLVMSVIFFHIYTIIYYDGEERWLCLMSSCMAIQVIEMFFFFNPIFS